MVYALRLSSTLPQYPRAPSLLGEYDLFEDKGLLTSSENELWTLKSLRTSL